MRSNNNSVSCAENEEQLLRFLCANGEDLALRREAFQRLRQYSWRDNDHRILFEAIGALLACNSQNVLEHLPAELTRRGFPDISCDALAGPSPMKTDEALALAQKLLRASQ
jgi:hypothetical protein